MELGTKDGEEFKKEKDLIEFDDITGPDIVNQITTMKNEKSSKNKERIIENLDTYKVHLTDQELNDFENELKKYKVYGHRGISF